MAKVLGKNPFSYQKEYNSFLDDLKRFHHCRGTLFRTIPRLYGKEVDLYLLYTKVTALGGWEKVNNGDKWENIVEHFHIPKETTNGAQALKLIYMRYLDLYEKVNHFGVDPDRRDEDEEEGLPAHRRKTVTLLTKVPMFYNYKQHNVPEHIRASNGLSNDFAPRSEYEKLEKSLLSGLPNEVDFAINVCTLLSNEGRHVLKLDQSHRLIELLMAQVGIYTDGPGSYIKFHDEWKKLTGRNFVRFWCDSVKDKQAQDLVSPSAAVHLQDSVASSKIPGDDLETSYELDEDVNEHIFNFGRELGISDVEGQRVMQLASILRNLSFEEENQMALSSNLLIFRFLLLCTYSKYSCLKQIGLDTIGNIAIQMVLEPIDCWTTQLIMKTICRCLASHDKFDIVRGMEILSKLCQVDENEEVIAEHLELKAYDDIINMLSVLDIQLIVHTLEVLYQLSELGEITTTHIANVRSSVDMLVQLVTIEAQSYGQNALFGVKVVEHAPPPMPTPQPPMMSQRPVHHPPPQHVPQQQFMQQRHMSPAPHPPGPPPPQHHTMHHQAPPPPQQQQPKQQSNQDAESEQFACNWLNAHLESAPGFHLARSELYSAYLATCGKNPAIRIISALDFMRCLKLVFPDVECLKIERPNGAQDIQFNGIRRRPVARPFPLPGEMIHRTIITRPHMSPSPQTSCSPRPLAPPQGPLMPPLSPSPHMTPPMSPAQRYSSPMPPQSPSPHRPTSTSSCDSRPSSVIQQQLNSPPNNAMQPNSQAPGNIQVPSIHQALFNGPQRPMTPQSPSSQSSYPSSAPSPTLPTNKQPADTIMIKSLLANKVHSMQMARMQQQSNQANQPPQPTVVQPTGVPAQRMLPVNQQGQPVNIVSPQGQQFINQGPMPDYTGQGPKPMQPGTPQGQVFPQRCIPAQQAQGAFGAPPHQYGSFQRNRPQLLGNVQLNQNQSSSRKRRGSSPGHSPGRLSPKGTRSRSPKAGGKPKSPKNVSPRPGSPYGLGIGMPHMHQKGCQLEVCGDVERAQDVVREDELLHEAKIERIENHCARMDIVENNNSTTQENRNETEIQEPGCSNYPAAQGVPLMNNMQIVPQVPMAVIPNPANPVPVVIPQNSAVVVPQNSVPLTVTQHSIPVAQASREISQNTDNQVVHSHPQNPGNPTVNQGPHPAAVPARIPEVVQTPQHVQIPTNGISDSVQDTAGTNANGDSQSNSVVEPMEVDKVTENSVPPSTENGSQQNVTRSETFPSVPCENNVEGNERTLPAPVDTRTNCATDQQFTGNDLNDKDKDKKRKDGDKKNPAKDLNESHNPANSPLLGDRRKLVNGSVSPSEYHKLPQESDISVQQSQGYTKKTDDPKQNLSQVLDKPEKLVVNGLVNHLGNGDILKDVEKQLPAVVATVLAEDIVKPVSKTKENYTDSVGAVSKSKDGPVEVPLQNGYLSDVASPNPEDLKSNVIKTNGNDHEDKCSVDTVDAALKDSKTAISESNEIQNPVQPVVKSENSECKTNGPGSNSGEKSEQCRVMTDSETRKEEAIETAPSPSNASSTKSDVKPSNLDLVLKDITDIIEDKSVEEMLGTPPMKTAGRSGGVVYYNEIKIGELASNMKARGMSDNRPEQKPVDNTNISYVPYQGSPMPNPMNIPNSNPKSQFSGASKRPAEDKGAKMRKKTRSRASSIESRRSSSQSVVSSVSNDFICEWANCRKCFENAKDVFPHVYKVHLNPHGAGVCQWDTCDRLVRQKFSLCTHVQDRHCTDHALKASLARRQQAAQAGVQPQMCPTPPPPPIYPNDAAIQAIRRFSARPPYQELMEPKEGPVTKHIRLTSALILRNLARYSAAGRSLIKRHENQLAYVSLSSVESSTAIANCLWELHQHH